MPPSALSLFQLARVDSLASPLVSLAGLNAAISAFVSVLLEREIAATLWWKPTAKGIGLQQLERYRVQTGPARSLYVLMDSAAIALPKTNLTPLPLQAGMLAKDEILFLAIAPQFCGAIVAQPVVNSRQYLLYYCFEPAAIATLRAAIAEALSVEDSLPSQLLDCINAPLPPSSPATPFFTHFLLQQIQATEATRNQTTALESGTDSAKAFFNQGLQELGTTLTRMKTALSLLGAAQLKASQRQRYLELLQQECDRQNSLLSGMRLLVELDETPGEQAKTSVQLAEIIPGIVSTYQPLAMEKGIQLGYTLPSGLPPVGCPASWLQQITINLLNNSLQWTLAGGKVSVLASRQGEYIQLIFKDTGTGIARSNLTKIFDSFYREGTPIDENYSGAGLGLTIVQKLIGRCGGKISASSQVKKGSTFKVLLPITSNANNLEP